MKKKTQILIIHGGNTFKSRRDFLKYLRAEKISLEKRVNWSKDYLEKKFGKNFEIIRPRMPMADDARYKEWKIIFEKYFPHLKNNIILIGYYLGGIFLARYLSENKFPKKILATYLVCPPFNGSHSSLGDLVGGFKLKSDLSLIEKNSPNLNLLFSKDDKVVPIFHAEKYRKKLKNAKITVYKGMNGHFNTPKFPQIIKMIKECVKKK